ncbi:hypothetical protein GSF24_34110, partial [Microbispora triticiradicis]|nr:hypothetical protein [Microbispora triticiradicis]
GTPDGESELGRDSRPDPRRDSQGDPKPGSRRDPKHDPKPGSRRDSRPERGAEAAPERPVRPFSQEDTQPSLVRPRGTSRPSRPPGAGRPPGQRGGSRSGTSEHAAPPGTTAPPGSRGGPGTPPGQDTPLYDALLSQIRAREARANTPEPTEALVPALDRALDPAPAEDLERSARPSPGVRIRIVAMLARVVTLLRATAVRIIIVMVAGAAGTVAGINLFAPAPQPRSGSVPAGITQTTAGPGAAGAGAPLGAGTASAPASIPVDTPAAGTGAGGTSTDGAAGTDGTGTNGTGTDGTTTDGGPEATATASQAGEQHAPADTPASPASVLMGAWGIQAPNVITLDAFGRGTISLSTTAGKSVKWRITAPGLSVVPSSGTLKPRHTAVLTLRAQRVRYWCGVPAPTTTPLVLHGPKGERTATVRWSTC